MKAGLEKQVCALCIEALAGTCHESAAILCAALSRRAVPRSRFAARSSTLKMEDQPRLDAHAARLSPIAS